MKTLLILTLVLASTLDGAGQGDDDLASTVIRSESRAGYNPVDKSEAELNKAATINSALRLQYMMLHEVTDQELRVCYALRVLESQIAAARVITSGSNSNSSQNRDQLDVLLKRQAELARQLRDLQDKRPNQALQTTPMTRSEIREDH